jgi:putative oxidoreductase
MPGRQLAALCLVSVACGFITPTRHAVKPSFDPLQLAAKKESTWDRLTGPKLFKTVKRTEGIHAVPLVPLRVIAGILMIHHGSEGGFWPANYGTPGFDGFVTYVLQPYFSFLPGSLETWSAIHDYAEFWGGALLAVGFLTRPAALSLLVTMAAAVYFHVASTGLQGAPFGHVENYSYNFEEPALYGLIFLLFFFNGPGPLSVDSAIYSALAPDDDD